MRRLAPALLVSALPLLLFGAFPARADGPLPLRSAAPQLHRLEAADAFTFIGGGDIALPGNADPRVLAGVRSYLHGVDLAVGNLEGTLTTGGSPKCSGGKGCFTFRGSPAWAPALRAAGFSVLNVANNHALDFGPGGQRDTLAALQRAGLLEQGLPGQVLYVSIRGNRIALIGCAPYEWAQSLLDIMGTARLVRRAAQRADVVIVYIHAGAEGASAAHVQNISETYLGEPRGNSTAFAHAMIGAGADLVFGSGPHVVRGVEWYGRRLIAYSLGNLAGTSTLSTSGTLGTSALLRATIDTHGRILAASIVPLRLSTSGTPSFDPTRDAVSRIRELSREDFGARATRISAAGRLSRP